MVQNELDKMLNEISQQLSQQNISLEMDLNWMGKTPADMREELSEEAQRRVKYQLILAAIVKAENIETTDEEVEEEFKEMATIYNQDVEQIKSILSNQIQYIKEDLAVRKALQLVKDNVK